MAPLKAWVASFSQDRGAQDRGARSRCKITYAERFAHERGLSLADSFYFGDSITDLPILLEVGDPRVVNPDPRLRREAKRRDWQVWSWAGSRER